MKYFSIIISILGICFFACKGDVKNESTRIADDISKTYVKMMPVVKNAESSEVSVLGIVMSESEAKPSFKTGGIIQKTYVKEGDLVKKGQLLATLIMDEIEAQVSLADEGLLKAERDFKRAQNLYADSVATLEQLQNAKTGYEVALKSNNIAKFNRNFSEVRAPIDGKIVKQIMHSGEVVGPGIPVFAILGIGSQDWVIQAGLVDRDWARVSKGDEVSIEMTAFPGKIFSGVVSNKSSIGGNASGTFDIEIKFKSQPKDLAVGLNAKTTIYTKKSEVYTTIPLEALVKSNGTIGFAFTVENNKAKKIELKIAKLLGDRVAVSEGLEGVSEVVTTGAMYLEEGDVVIR